MPEIKKGLRKNKSKPTSKLNYTCIKHGRLHILHSNQLKVDGKKNMVQKCSIHKICKISIATRIMVDGELLYLCAGYGRSWAYISERARSVIFQNK